MIDVDRDADGIVTLTWDLPGRSQNVLNQESMDTFDAALKEAAADESVTGIVIASAKKAFIAGADLKMLEAICAGDRSVAELNQSVGDLSRIIRRMETCGKPVVAAISGTALGGGMEICLGCHYRVVSDDHRIKLGFPEATLGLLPGGGGTQRLPRMVGIQASMPLLLEGKQLRPDAALKLGMVDAVVPADQLIDAAKAWIKETPNTIQPWDQKGYEVPNGDSSDANVGRTFMVATAMFNAKTFGNYPAGKAILSCLWEGLRLDIDSGLKVEGRYMVSLLTDPVAGNMIRTLFMSLQDANKLARRPEGPDKLKPKKIGILGAGLMGSGIAFVSAKAGIDCVVIDTDEKRAKGAVDYATQRLDKAIAKKRSTEEKKAALLAKIHPTTDYADLDGCDLVIEAVFEDRGVKAEVTKRAEKQLAESAFIASNTSTLPITGLAEAASRQENFVGLHFFSPVERMPLVEVIRAEKTSDETLAHALDFVQAIGKTPIVVNDSRGFYTSRVFGTYITEGMVMLQEGIKPALIENAGKRSGMPMPPLGLADEVGLGLMYQVGAQTRADLGDAAPHNPSTAVLEAMVQDHDRAGKRTGAGFYEYSDKGKHLWSGLAELYPNGEQPEVTALVERFLFAQAVEAARCMDEGVLLAAADADVGAVMGWGFAPYTGGPLSYIDTMGASTFVARADELAAELGERFSPPEILRTMAAEGGRFY